MGEYDIVPEFRHFKAFPFIAITYQLVAIGFAVFGCFVASVGFILALFFQFCSVYYTGLFLCNRYYRLNVTSSFITVRNLFNKPRRYHADKLRWKMRRIPWYNSYFILLYSSGRIPIAIIKPHWKNALRMIHFPHSGIFTSVELRYLNFLESAGLLKRDGGRFYVLR